jgi:hypothetical protein
MKAYQWQVRWGRDAEYRVRFDSALAAAQYAATLLEGGWPMTQVTMEPSDA